MLLAAILFAVLLCCITYLYLKDSFKYWKKKGIDFVEPSYPFGNFKDAFLQRIQIGEFVAKIYNSSKKDLVGFYIFGTPHLVVRSPSLLKQILVSDFQYFSDRTLACDEKADPICTKMLLIMRNPEWKTNRARVTPVFTTSKLRGMIGFVEKSANDLVDYLDRIHEDGPIEAKEMAAKFTTDAITSCAFGVEAQCFKEEDSPFRVAGRQMIATTTANGIRFITYFLLPKLVSYLRIGFFDPVCITFLKHAFLNTISMRESSGYKRNDLIDIIIDLKKQNCWKDFNDHAVAQGVQFFGAGFETTSATISFTLYELCLNEDIQEKARNHVKEVYNKHQKWSYEVLQQLNYLEMVILETLRKYPSLPFLDRRCTRDYKIPDTDIVIEKGTPIFIPMLGFHYDERYFPNPHEFKPERFTPEEVAKRPQHTYLPFGQGPRFCLGERFAMNAVKLALSKILLNYKAERCETTPTRIVYVPQFFALSPIKGLPMRFVKLSN